MKGEAYRRKRSGLRVLADRAKTRDEKATELHQKMSRLVAGYDLNVTFDALCIMTGRLVGAARAAGMGDAMQSVVRGIETAAKIVEDELAAQGKGSEPAQVEV